ncbi:hypothetical protein RHT_01325 [Candidatus Rhabdochlamydia sp. T3358]|nr:hypothetical protein RHT_01325 [Candidatus Rhabdochlamydia sp. T3358]
MIRNYLCRHNVPKEVIIKRYYTGLKNLLTHYLPLVDNGQYYGQLF